MVLTLTQKLFMPLGPRFYLVIKHVNFLIINKPALKVNSSTSKIKMSEMHSNGPKQMLPSAFVNDELCLVQLYKVVWKS